jgi:hypothetical protein
MGFFDFLRTRQGARAPRATAAALVRPQLEGLESRVVPYAVSGNAWPSPQLITISFVPDGTIVGSNSNGYIYSNLFATFNGKFGSPAVWQNQILKAAQSWAQQTNINFAVVPDSGADMGSGNYQQGDPSMGDIRIGGYNFGSNNLAQTYMPPPVNNFSLAGDMQFNTGKSFSIGVGGYDLNTVALHEIGHALGMYHSGYTSADMYANYNAIKNSLNNDDINGIRNIYSGGQARTQDSFNGGSGTQSLVGGLLNTVTGVVGGVVNTVGGLLGGLLGGSPPPPPGNGSFSGATSLNSYIDPNALTGALTGLDIASAGQAEYYAVTAPQTTSGTFTLNVQSSGISLLNPSVTVYAADQYTQLASAAGSGYQGSTLTLTVPNVTPGQVLYVKVAGADSSAFGTGNYGMSLDFASPGSLVAIPLVNTQLANGNPLSSGGGQAIKTLSGVKMFHTDDSQKLTAEGVVNTYAAGSTTADGAQPVGMAANGNTVVVWSSQGQDGDGWGVYGQRYDVNGMPLGGEFQINATTAGDQNHPSVAVAADGSFLVVWQSQGQDGAGWGVYGQRYDASGNAVGGEFQVNTTTAGDQENPSVATDGQGDYTVTWQSQGQDGNGWGVFAQRYNAAGALGGEVQVNSTTAGDQQNARVAMSSNGSSVVVWQSQGQDGDGWGIFGQRYDSTGSPVGSEFQVNTTSTGDQVDPSVAISAAGAFVVTWSSQGQDGDGWGIFAQRFFTDGSTNGQEFQVNVTTAGDQTSSSVSMDSRGNFLVAWQSYGQDGDGWGVYGRQYNAVTGVATGNEFQLSSSTAGDQVHPAWAQNDAGNAVAVWSGGTILALNNSVLLQQFDVSAGDDLNDLSTDDFPPVDGTAVPADQTFTDGQQAAATPVRQTVSVAPEQSAPAAQDARPVAGHPTSAPVGILAVLGVEAPASLTPAGQILTVQGNAGVSPALAAGHLPTGGPANPVVLALSGSADEARPAGEVLFVTPDGEQGQRTPPVQAAPLDGESLYAVQPSEQHPAFVAAPRAEAIAWPRLCDDCFQDVNWLEESLTEPPAGTEAPAEEARAGLCPVLVAGLAVVVAGSWKGDGLWTDERRRPVLRPRR